MEYRHGKHSVYSLNYHIVFVTKYRRPCITEEIGDFLKAEIIRLIESMEGHVSEVEYHRDHIHILAELSPKNAISEQIGVLKGVTARNVKKRYGDQIAKYLWKGQFWAPSFFIATAGGVTLDVLKRYVAEQRTGPSKGGWHDHKKNRHSSPSD